MFPSQTNTIPGDVVYPAGEDLSAKEGFLAVLTHDSGSPEAVLPTANTDLANFIVGDPGADTEDVTLIPLTSGKQYRVKLKGTCNPGNQLVLADVGTAADKGMVRALPAAAGDYNVLAIAEEAGVDGQLILLRGIGPITVTVS
ncbi:MAG: hypothetical protein AAGJ81_01425 [Verrucomicrobiota bacterium]